MISIQRCIICFIPTSGLEKNAKKRSLPLVVSRTIFKTALNHDEYQKVFNMEK